MTSTSCLAVRAAALLRRRLKETFPAYLPAVGGTATRRRIGHYE